MSFKNYGIYNLETGLIENAALIDSAVLDTLVGFPADGYGIVEMPETHVGEWSVLGIGWSYLNGEFIEPTTPPISEQPSVLGAETL